MHQLILWNTSDSLELVKIWHGDGLSILVDLSLDGMMRKKERYENGGSDHDCGHYLNIINSKYKVTGFAVNQYGLDDKYADLTHEQSFMTYDITENALSLEEYTAKFMEYYNKLMEAPNLEEAAKAKLDEAKVALDAANATLAAAEEKRKTGSCRVRDKKAGDSRCQRKG